MDFTAFNDGVYECAPATTRFDPVPTRDASLVTKQNGDDSCERVTLGVCKEPVPDHQLRRIGVALHLHSYFTSKEFSAIREDVIDRIGRENQGAVSMRTPAYRCHLSRVWNSLPVHRAWKKKLQNYCGWRTNADYWIRVVMGGEENLYQPGCIFGKDGAANDFGLIMAFASLAPDSDKFLVAYFLLLAVAMRAYSIINDRYFMYQPVAEFKQSMPAHLLLFYRVDFFFCRETFRPPPDFDMFKYAREHSLTDFVHAVVLWSMSQHERLQGRSSEKDEEEEAEEEKTGDSGEEEEKTAQDAEEGGEEEKEARDSDEEEAPKKKKKKKKKKRRDEEEQKGEKKKKKKKKKEKKKEVEEKKQPVNPHTKWVKDNLTAKGYPLTLNTTHYSAMPIEGLARAFNSALRGDTETQVQPQYSTWFAMRLSAVHTFKVHAGRTCTSVAGEAGLPMILHHLMGNPSTPTLPAMPAWQASPASRLAAFRAVEQHISMYISEKQRVVVVRAMTDYSKSVNAQLRSTHKATPRKPRPRRRKTPEEKEEAAAAGEEKGEEEGESKEEAGENKDNDDEEEEEEEAKARGPEYPGPRLSAVDRRYCLTPKTDTGQCLMVLPAIVSDRGAAQSTKADAPYAPLRGSRVIYNERSPVHLSIAYLRYCHENGSNFLSMALRARMMRPNAPGVTVSTIGGGTSIVYYDATSGADVTCHLQIAQDGLSEVELQTFARPVERCRVDGEHCANLYALLQRLVLSEVHLVHTWLACMGPCTDDRALEAVLDLIARGARAIDESNRRRYTRMKQYNRTASSITVVLEEQCRRWAPTDGALRFPAVTEQQGRLLSRDRAQNMARAFSRFACVTDRGEPLKDHPLAVRIDRCLTRLYMGDTLSEELLATLAQPIEEDTPVARIARLGPSGHVILNAIEWLQSEARRINREIWQPLLAWVQFECPTPAVPVVLHTESAMSVLMTSINSRLQYHLKRDGAALEEEIAMCRNEAALNPASVAGFQDDRLLLLELMHRLCTAGGKYAELGASAGALVKVVRSAQAAFGSEADDDDNSLNETATWARMRRCLTDGLYQDPSGVPSAEVVTMAYTALCNDRDYGPAVERKSAMQRLVAIVESMYTNPRHHPRARKMVDRYKRSYLSGSTTALVASFPVTFATMLASAESKWKPPPLPAAAAAPSAALPPPHPVVMPAARPATKRRAVSLLLSPPQEAPTKRHRQALDTDSIPIGEVVDAASVRLAVAVAVPMS